MDAKTAFIATIDCSIRDLVTTYSSRSGCCYYNVISQPCMINRISLRVSIQALLLCILILASRFNSLLADGHVLDPFVWFHPFSKAAAFLRIKDEPVHLDAAGKPILNTEADRS